MNLDLHLFCIVSICIIFIYVSGLQLLWSNIYSLHRIVTIVSELRYFQYKILHNLLYLNKKRFIFGKTDTKLWSFCNHEDETTLYLFANCTKTDIIRANIKEFFNGNLKHPSLTLQSAIFGFSDVDQDIFLVSNYVLLLFKHFMSISRDSNILLFSRFFRNLQKVYTIEPKTSQESERKKKQFHKEWQKTQNKLFSFINACYIT